MKMNLLLFMVSLVVSGFSAQCADLPDSICCTKGSGPDRLWVLASRIEDHWWPWSDTAELNWNMEGGDQSADANSSANYTKSIVETSEEGSKTIYTITVQNDRLDPNESLVVKKNTRGIHGTFSYWYRESVTQSSAYFVTTDEMQCWENRPEACTN